MEIQLQELIERIKKNGVEVAENEASAIIASANAEADKIIAEAKEKAEKLLRDAKEQNERFLLVSEEALRQAGRNLLISFRESVTKELEAIAGDKVNEVYSSKNLGDIIIKVVEAWSKAPDVDDITVLLNSKDTEALEASLLAAFKKHLQGGVTLKANDNFDGGFRIAVNGGSVYYDYSAEAVTEMMSAYLNPRVSALLKEAEKV